MQMYVDGSLFFDIRNNTRYKVFSKVVAASVSRDGVDISQLNGSDTVKTIFRPVEVGKFINHFSFNLVKRFTNPHQNTHIVLHTLWFNFRNITFIMHGALDVCSSSSKFRDLASSLSSYI